MREPILDIRDLEVTYKLSRGLFARGQSVPALRGVSLNVIKGEVLAIVGESGSGKTTLAMSILNLNSPSHGEVLFRGKSVRDIGRKAYSRHVQPVFQDPYSSLNPRRNIADAIAQPMAIHGIGSGPERSRRVRELMDLVGLPERFAERLPHELSGGQRQRVAIARALVIKPDILLCDEPTSALDVSVQAQILNLLQDLRRELDLTFVVITHNLAIVEHMADRVAVMYLGQIVEEASVAALFTAPGHPYSQALLDSVLTPEPTLGLPAMDLASGPASPIAPPSGCHFHPRCKHAFAPCSTTPPVRIDCGAHSVNCHLHDSRYAAVHAHSNS